ncbi:hypothetical protein SBOR_1006 [Sclerotinia borealis F-4128]|uniref:Uncharacterized protein n=1 Tax=Sclerotinia borealis (strain F-4128) TaxID=1432307 RepID=W9CRR9_SCLBF|nr:hypothetical protein SBOR_1006 [Sclerotinia borealis F-4128]
MYKISASMSFEMDTEMKDANDATIPDPYSGGAAYRERGEPDEEKLEKGNWAEEPQRTPAFKGFALATPAAPKQSARLARVEVWKQKIEEKRARKKLTMRMEAASIVPTLSVSAPPASLIKGADKAALRKARKLANKEIYKVEIAAAKACRELEQKKELASVQDPLETSTQPCETRSQSLTLAAPLLPLSPGSMYKGGQGSVSSDASNKAEGERGQDIDEEMYGGSYVNEYDDAYCEDLDVYRCANVYVYDGLGFESRPRKTKRGGAKRRKSKQKAAELRASLQEHGLLSTSSYQQPAQEISTRTFLNCDTIALDPNSSDKQQEEQDLEACGGSINSGDDPQQQRLEHIDALRKNIMSRKTSLQARGLLPVSPSQQLVQEGFTRSVSDTVNAASSFHSSNKQEEERGQKTDEEKDEECLSSGAGPQKKRRKRSPSSFKRLKTFQAALEKRKELKLVKAQQDISKEQGSHELIASPSQKPMQDTSTIDQRKHGSNDVSSHEQEKAVTQEVNRTSISTVPKEIMLLIEREKERRRKSLALENPNLIKDGQQEQSRELSGPEDIKVSAVKVLTEKTTSNNTTKTRNAIREKMIEKLAAAHQTALQKQGLQLHVASPSQQPFQENCMPVSHEVPQLAHEQEHFAIEEEDGESLSVPKDVGAILKNSKRRIDTRIRDVTEETRSRPAADVKYLSEETRPKIIPDTITNISPGMYSGMSSVPQDIGAIPEYSRLRLDTVVEYAEKEDVTGMFSVPKDIGNILDNARRRIDTRTGFVMDETRSRSIMNAKDLLVPEDVRLPPKTNINVLPISKQLADFLAMDLRRDFAVSKTGFVDVGEEKRSR